MPPGFESVTAETVNEDDISRTVLVITRVGDRVESAQSKASFVLAVGNWWLKRNFSGFEKKQLSIRV